MIENIKRIISNIKEIDDWKINEKIVESKELFFVKKELDMNRAKDVHHIRLTLYKNFEENGKRYKGSSNTSIHPTMNDEEIEQVIREAVYAAGFIKNEYFPLVEPKLENIGVIENKFNNDFMSNWMPKLTDEIFLSDKYENGWINSAELFLDKVNIRIVNSKGIDIRWKTYRGELEFITTWKEEEGEEIELYEDILFSDYDEKLIANSVDEILKISKDKSIAKPTPTLEDIPVILSGRPVKEFFNYYYDKAAASSIYQETSTLKIDESIQGHEVKGDKVNMALDPYLNNSTGSSPYDEDGLLLSKFSLYEDGILKRYWGSKRFSHYLGIEATGIIRNILVEGGSKSLKEIKEGPYLELQIFSDFQMDTLTGDFAGEIRLGWYNDGEKTIPVTGGSISGNINDVHKEMFLSKELQRLNNFKGPRSIKLKNLNIAGN